MVLSDKDLVRISDNIVFILRHNVAGVQIYTNETMLGKTFVQTLDPIGNVKSSKEFDGFKGFWEATMEFEKIIASRLDLEEIIGYEVGDIVFIEKPIGNLKKGDAIAITELTNEGTKIKKFIKVDKQQLQTIKQDSRVKQLIKSEALDFLFGRGFKSLEELMDDAPYMLGLDDNSVTLVPTSFSWRGISPGQKYVVDPSVGGGEVTLENFVFETNNDGESQLKAKVLFEDGSDGIMEINKLSKK
jgi:hypothetical protein